MSTAGPLTPSSAATTAPNWTSPTNIEGSSSFATFTVTAGNDTLSGYLQGTNFGFSIPAGATINGIVVTFDRKCSSAANFAATTNDVSLLKAGVAAGTPKSGGSNYTTSSVTETYGTSSDLWGTTWTSAQINASNFGLEMRADGDNSLGGLSRTMDINNYTVTVFYTAAAGVSKAVCSQTIGW